MCDGFGLTKMCLSHEENTSVSVEVEGGAVRWHSRAASGAEEASGMRRGGHVFTLISLLAMRTIQPLLARRAS
jgi:hypothetical protein